MSSARSVLGLLLLLSGSAFAFSEDTCLTTDGTWINCLPLPSRANSALVIDCLPGNYSAYCIEALSNLQNTIKASKASEQNPPWPGSARSMVHMDMTFYIAEALGFDASSAYWIAAYDEATDLGEYVPRDQGGNLLPAAQNCVHQTAGSDCLITREIDGLVRGNLLTGGVFLHFMAPYNEGARAPVVGVDGLNPDSGNPATEPLLYNVKRWAEGGAPMCAHGLTSRSPNGDYASGAGCYVGTTTPGVIVATLNEISLNVFPALPLPPELPELPILGVNYRWDVATGNQIITQTTPSPLTSQDFDGYAGDTAPLAKIGIYLHALQDRISHHRCIDAGFLSGPDPEHAFKIEGFNANFSNQECQQPWHVLRHAFETGEPQQTLVPADRTLQAAVYVTAQELSSIIADSGMMLPATRAEPVATSQFLAQLYSALQRRDVYDRNAAVVGVAHRYGLGLMPGYTYTPR